MSESRFPPLSRAGEQCVLCGLCVRVCSEVVGSSAIGFASRGWDRHVDSPFSLGSEDCLGCGACAAVCPTNAILVRLGVDKVTVLPFKNTVQLHRCVVCGKPAAPSPLLTFVKSRLPPALAPRALCPECRLDKTAWALAAAALKRT